MNRSKAITVRYFDVNVDDIFFKDFESVYRSNLLSDNHVRIFNIRKKKYLIKIHDIKLFEKNDIYFISAVRERNTWQVKAVSDGNISGMKINQGIVGDPYYFAIFPKEKLLLGFTTGVSGSLKSVGFSILEQFKKDRTISVVLEPVSKKKEFAKLREIEGINKLYFKVEASSLSKAGQDAPNIFEELQFATFMGKKSQIALTFTDIGDEGFTENDVIEIVNYLAEHDGCSALSVQGLDNDGSKVHLDFSDAFALFKTEVRLRNQFVDEKTAWAVLLDAMSSYDKLELPK